MRMNGIVAASVVLAGLVCGGAFAQAPAPQASEGAVPEAALPPSLRPMYGGVENSAADKQADAAFIAKVESTGQTRTEAAKRIIMTAWGYFQHGDLDATILRFNQAWLLDPENPEVYHGFAAVTTQRAGEPAEIDKYYKMGLSKSGAAAPFHVDYARFLSTQQRFDDAIAEAAKAMEMDKTAHNARAQTSYAYFGKKDLPKACDWAKQAQANGDPLDSAYLKAVCK